MIGPYRTYRTMEMVPHVRQHDLNRIKSVVDLRKRGVPSSALFFVAECCGQMEVFEAVRGEDGITPEEAAWLLMLRRTRRPWYLRLAMWIFGRSLPFDGTGEQR